MARPAPLIVSQGMLDEIKRTSYAEGYRKAIEDVTGAIGCLDDGEAVMSAIMERLVELPDPR